MTAAPTWSSSDVTALSAAYEALEHPSLAARFLDALGTPIEAGLKRLPKSWRSRIESATDVALRKALQVALKTLSGEPSKAPRRARWAHKAAAMATGAAGGAGGLLTLTVELPITTCIMLRAIADVARGEGEDLTRPDARLACIEVFALGGTSQADDAGETGYFLARAGLARELSRASEYLAAKGVVDEGAPLLLQLVAKIAPRFSVQVSEKVAAEWIPIVGSVGGALINLTFVNHFQSIAHGHFTIRRLERKYGAESVRETYRTNGSKRPGK